MTLFMSKLMSGILELLIVSISPMAIKDQGALSSLNTRMTSIVWNMTHRS